MAAACALLLYADDAVQLRYRDGASLLLSPCGMEFMYERPQAGGHPVQRPDRGRHRTEYATSRCREQVLQALNFRNTFSSRPFLPSSLIPSEETVTLLADISEVPWPALEDDTGCVTHLEDGSVKVSSLDGHAHLYMSALQREFTIEFLCQLSCAPYAPEEEAAAHDEVNSHPKSAGVKTTRNINRSKYSSCVLQEESTSCLTKHASRYTWLLQRFSVAACPQAFQYPMDLALHFHQESARQGDGKQCVDREGTTTDSDLSERSVSILPRALPLTCSAAHLHRLSFCKFSSENENLLAVNSLPLKVAIYNDILYRFFLDGTNLVEIHPGDGSVFISEGDCMGKYFKRCFMNDTKQMEERLYSARDLPPDMPRTLYSVRSVISQARRFLEFCCKQKLSIDPLSHTWCWRTGSGPDSRAVVPELLQQSFIPSQGRLAVYSNNAVCASYLDGVLLYMSWNFANFNKSEERPDSTALQKSSSTVGHEQFAWCCLRFPNGSSKLVEMGDPGEYASYITTAMAWCRWLDDKSLGEKPSPITTETDILKGVGMVAQELEKIRQFNFLMEKGGRGDLKASGQPDKAAGVTDGMGDMNIQSVLEKTSKAIQDIDLLLSSRK